MVYPLGYKIKEIALANNRALEDLENGQAQRHSVETKKLSVVHNKQEGDDTAQMQLTRHRLQVEPLSAMRYGCLHRLLSGLTDICRSRVGLPTEGGGGNGVQIQDTTAKEHFLSA